MTLALVRGQLETAARDAGKAVNKWKVFNDVGEAKDVFGLQDRSITVLQALLSFYPNDELSDESGGLIVFPSNSQLSLRAHGIPASTLRRHIAALVAAGLILRRDSANGKRYARRAPGGGIEQAFGFDLSPLVACADELADRAARIIEERRAVDALRERVTLARRDIAKMLAFAVERCVDADLPALHREYRELLDGRPRAVRRETLEESGIRLGRVVYHASQPWPFPYSLMIGCFGEALNDDIHPDFAELEDCRWFERAEVLSMLDKSHPTLFTPPPGAIAHHLIRHWAEAV